MGHLAYLTVFFFIFLIRHCQGCFFKKKIVFVFLAIYVIINCGIFRKHSLFLSSRSFAPMDVP